jgi:hypothetical protein
MSDEQEHIEVELEEPKKDDELKVEVKDDPEPEKKAKKAEKTEEVAPEDGIQELKKRLEQEKQARIEAERRAHQANNQINKAYQEVKDTNYQLVTNAIETVKSRAEMLKNAYRESMSVSDFDKAADIQQAMIENDRQLSDLKRGEKALKEQMEESNAQPTRPVSPPAADPIEQMAQAVSPASAAWLRDNRDNLKDERSIRKMFRAHEDALDEGILADTPEYFGFIEQRLGVRRYEEDAPEPLSAASAPAPRKSVSPPAAPVSRGNGTRPGVVRLTREQADTAKMMGMTEKEYATAMLALREEGKLTH